VCVCARVCVCACVCVFVCVCACVCVGWHDVVGIVSCVVLKTKIIYCQFLWCVHGWQNRIYMHRV